MSLFSGKKIFLLGFIIVLLFAIPLTVFLTQKSQQVTSQAAPATTLILTPQTQPASIGDIVKVDVTMDPGTNQVSFVKLTVKYDETKFSIDQSNGFTWNKVAFGDTALQGPTYTTGNVSITLSVGSDLTKIISASTKIATINLKAIAGTNGATTSIEVVRTQTQVLSVGAKDQANEDVLVPGQPTPATVTIKGGSSATTSTNKDPICSGLVLDRSATGAAPYSLTLTATGKDDDGTITKVSFAFGNGKIGDVTQAGGIGTNKVNAQISHTYQNAGTYTASAVLTDNQNSTSATTTCTTTITVTGGTSAGGTSAGSTGGSGGVVVAPTAIPTVAPTVAETTPILTVTPPPPLVVGPGDKIVGIGAMGIMLSILGALLLAF